MKLLPLPPALLRVGEPLPVPLRDADGRLLWPRGHVLADEAQRQHLLERQPQVEEMEMERLQRDWVQVMERMVVRDEVLGRIAQVRPPQGEGPAPTAEEAGGLAAGPWTDRCLQLRQHLGNTLQAPGAADFLPRLQWDHEALDGLMHQAPDDTLLVLLHDIAHDHRDYGVQHSLVVAALCAAVAADTPGAWPPTRRRVLLQAALTSNLSIVNLKTRLAQAPRALTPEERARLAGHTERSAQALQAAGVDDNDWLEAVARQPRGTAELARLLHKADVFTARLSPRQSRVALSATQAARAAFLTVDGDTDPMGAQLIKALGLYPPGTWVRLKSKEVGLVRRRGTRTSEPWVASLMGASGLPLATPVLRDTANPAHQVVQALAPHEVKLRAPLEAVLAL